MGPKGVPGGSKGWLNGGQVIGPGPIIDQGQSSTRARNEPDTETNVSNLLDLLVLPEIPESSSNARVVLAEKSVKSVKLVNNGIKLAISVKLAK